MALVYEKDPENFDSYKLPDWAMFFQDLNFSEGPSHEPKYNITVTSDAHKKTSTVKETITITPSKNGQTFAVTKTTHLALIE